MRSVVVLLGLFVGLCSPALADSTINGLGAGSALTGTEQIPMYQGSNPATTTTPSALKTYLGVNVTAGCAGVVNPTPGTGQFTISTAEILATLAASNPAITTGYCGGLENLSNSGAQTPTILEAGAAGFAAGWYTDLCNINTGIQTLTPGGGTVGGAGALAFPAASAVVPRCARLVSDGVSNYAVVFSTLAFLTGPTSSTSGDIATFSSTTGLAVQDSGILASSLAPKASPTFTGTATMPDSSSFVSGGATLGGTLTAASLSTVGTVAGSLCQTSAGLVLYEVGVNCFAASSGTITAGTTVTSGITTGDIVSVTSNKIADSGVLAASVVVGPASAASGNIATYNGTTGKIIQDGGTAISALAPLASPTFTGTIGGAAETLTGVFTDSLSPAVSQSALLLSGSPLLTGGNGTTTFPLLYLNDGTGPTTFSTSGTEFGINAPTGFGGNFLDFHVNGGASVFNVNSGGSIVTGGGVTTISNITNAITLRTTTAIGNAVSLTTQATTTAATAGAINLTPGSASGTLAGGGGSINITAGSSTSSSASSPGGSVTITAGTSSSGTPGSIILSGLPTATGSYVCSSSGTISVEATACPASTMLLKNPLGSLSGNVAARGLDGLLAAVYTYKETEANDGHDHVGLYAEDVERMDHRCVNYDKRGVLQNYDERCVIAYLVADRANMKAEIEELKRKVH